MALADIKAKIEADAREQAEAILQRARGQAEEIRRKAQQEIEDIRHSFEERFAKEAPEISKRREAVARLDVEREMLNAKRRLISMVFDEALNQMISLDRAKREPFVERLLLASVQDGDEVVVVGPSEDLITEDWLKGFNDRHGKSLTLSDRRDPSIKGGFVVERGKISTNCTWEMLLRVFQEEREAEVVRQLFADR
ncbi:V-type ATP synthase subunit E [Thermanaerovibrio acidaminovorans]|jgi:V/A-type H+-transporting ATPase subunit E|uniref:H+transporting two-sector ATPase E subunit n=1 Tax=Thermanaerovibrio acidaminovorans (strain ATCC 49978 / DSM 6589 / Su883) TaxID=525903 RepID=D1B9Y5_THEAS|nr:V-type ATP synthase subunit E family protein [Thermanaerovibrio acidaminovorans]ACZ19088.1 H+transporting two-sector ATPase E subunit [Thermanaerovibrio acidaminovorans DSM 6589]